MLRRILAVACAVLFAAPVFASTHKDTFNVPCGTLWQAVRDTLRNSGKYGIIGISSEEMTASYNMGGNLTAKRTNSVVLNPKGEGACEMQVQTAFSGLVNNDYGDFKERVTKSLEKIKAGNVPAPPPGAPVKTPATDSSVAPATAPSTEKPAPATPGTAAAPASVPKG